MELTYGQLGGLNEAKRESEFAEARWLAAVSDDLSVRKEMCDLITQKRNPENRIESNLMWLAAWDAIEAIRLAQEAANDQALRPEGQ
jgi:hypothetical protein